MVPALPSSQFAVVLQAQDPP
jgi:hypothetical protein